MLTDDSRGQDQFSHFEYYLLGSIPVCFLVDKEGQRYGARVPSSVSGMLEHDATKLSKFSWDTDEFTKITETEFHRRVLTYVQPAPVCDLSAETLHLYNSYLVRQRIEKDSEERGSQTL